ncbi:hypothetical protein MUQ_23296 [Vibrio harveyi CAIM 1792]|nr:hypothetical protein MUQ_23296 [Vibrio harveyi CAIM 1792]
MANLYCTDHLKSLCEQNQLDGIVFSSELTDYFNGVLFIKIWLVVKLIVCSLLHLDAFIDFIKMGGEGGG